MSSLKGIIVAESDLAACPLKSEYVVFDGERIARRDLPGGAVSYYFSDHLKIASVITDSAGAQGRAVEQVLIERYGLTKNGGTLRNKINSISPTKNSDFYNKAKIFGQAVLDAIHYQY